MSWKNLKNFAIVLLLLMDITFLFLLIQRDYSAGHYESEQIDSAIEVFRKSELYVDRPYLSGPIVSLPVYTGKPGADSLSQTAVVRTLLSLGYRLSEEPGGIRCSNAVGDFYFGDDFSFYYTEKGRYDRPSDLLATERYIRLTEENDYRLGAIQVVDSFMDRYAFLSSGGREFGYEISFSEVYSSGVNYIVTLVQRIDGVPIHGEICVLVSGSRVLAADGVFVTSAPENRERAETMDLLNILFMEKAFLDARFRAGGSFSYTPMVLSEVEYCYAVYFDAQGSFYFVPLCTVRYMNGEVRSYNCVSGRLYS